MLGTWTPFIYIAKQRNKNKFTEDTQFGSKTLGAQGVDSDEEKDSSIPMELVSASF